MKHRLVPRFVCSAAGQQLALSLACLLASTGAQAGNIYWDAGPAGTGTDWTLDENWVGAPELAPADNISTDNAYFNTLTTGQPTLNNARSVAGIELETATGGWTLGGSGTLTLGSKGIDAQAFESGTNSVSVANIVMGSSTAAVWLLGVNNSASLQNTIVNIGSNIQLHETAQLQIQSPRPSGTGGVGGTGTVNVSGIISNTTGKTTSGPVKYLGGSASKNTFNVTGLNSYTGNTLVSAAVVNFNSLADDGTASALGASGIINITENSSFSTLQYNGTAPASTNRRLTIGLALAANAGAANINNNAATANTLSLTSTDSIIFGGTGNRLLGLGGTNTGNNTFAQLIENAPSGVTSVTKSSAGKWILTNTSNSFTGAITAAGGELQLNTIPDGGVIAYNGGTVTYTGTTADTSDRLLQIGTAGTNITAVLRSSGTGGTLDMTNTGAVTQGGGITAGSGLRLGGSNTGDNFFRASLGDLNSVAIKLEKADAGKWILTNTNGFTGGLTMAGGTLGFNADAALGTAGGAITFTGSSNLVSTGDATLESARTITVNSSRTASFGITTGTGTVLQVNSKITGAGNVSRVSSSAFTGGTVRHTNDTNDYTGSFDTRFGITEYTSVANADQPSALGAGSVINANNSSSAAILRHIGGSNSSTNRPINWSATTGALYLESTGAGSVSFLDTTTLVTGDGNKTLFLGGTNSGDNSLGQPVGNGPTFGITTLEKAGTGKWVLTAANPYSGNTTVYGGTLALGADSTIDNSPVISIASGATLDLSAKAAAFPISATQTLTGTGTITGQSLDVAGTVAPGTNGIGTLSTASLAFSGGSALAIQINTSAATADQIVVTGNVVLDGTVNLNLTDLGSDAALPGGTKLVLVDYSGVWDDTDIVHYEGNPVTNGSTITLGSNSFIVDYSDDSEPGGTAMTLTVPGAADPYTDWIGTFTSLTTPEQKAKTADPDGDGASNLEEFAFDGNPESGASTGKIQSSVATVGATKHLTLSIPVRNGASFTGSPSPASNQVDGVTYTILGSYNLSTFGETVVEVTPAIVTTPALSTGWSYKTFRLNADTGSQPRGFLRADITGTP